MLIMEIDLMDGRGKIEICINRQDADRVTAYIQEFKASIGMNECLESLLKDIGDFANNRSIGPAVQDALWDFRGMAYEGYAGAFKRR